MGLSVLCALVVLRNRSVNATETSAPFKSFQKSFYVVYLMAMLSDWLQGPYVYALYEHYGFGVGEIGRLFIAGFGSSMVFGTIIGSLADRFGRKLNCLIFCVFYGLSCVTKHYNDYNILMVGRVLGGIATSILFSAFESWMVSEHKSRNFDDSWLSGTFSTMIFGNGIIAIWAGVVAGFAAEKYGFVAPFDMSLFFLVVCGLVILATWSENYGDQGTASCSNFSQGWSVMASNEKVLLVGIMQTCFEASMYLFVFMWTPRLERVQEHISHGMVFAAFMVCVMIGSNMFGELLKQGTVEGTARYVFGLGGLSLLLATKADASYPMLLLAFCGFELACGCYFPTLGTLRGKYIPEEVRSTIMNFYRVGLNFIVVVVLWHIKSIPAEKIFFFCVCLQFMGFFAAFLLNQKVNSVPEDFQKVLGDDEEAFGLGSDEEEEVGELEASKKG